MALVVEYLEEAVAEAEAAAEWYAARSATAAAGFEAELAAAEVAIQKFPEAWPHHDHGTRRYLVLAVTSAGCDIGPDVNLDFNSTSMSSLSSGGTQFGATIDGVMWNWNVSWNDVKDTPDWVPGDVPAISMPQAIQRAQAEMPEYADSPELYRVDSVQWLPITECCNPNHAQKWIYLVDFERRERFESGARGTIRIPVLLDGRIIAGVREGNRP